MTTRALDLGKLTMMQKPRVLKVRPGNWYYSGMTWRNITPPWICEYAVHGQNRFKLFVNWNDAIRFALTEC